MLHRLGAVKFATAMLYDRFKISITDDKKSTRNYIRVQRRVNGVLSQRQQRWRWLQQCPAQPTQAGRLRHITSHQEEAEEQRRRVAGAQTSQYVNYIVTTDHKPARRLLCRISIKKEND